MTRFGVPLDSTWPSGIRHRSRGPCRMIHWRIRCTVFAALCAVAALSAAAADDPPEPLYPVPVRLHLSGETLARVFEYKKVEGVAAPKNPGATIPVGRQAGDAYGRVLTRVFHLSGDGVATDAEVEVSIEMAGLEFTRGLWRAVVEHLVVLRASSTELGRWKMRGEEPIAGIEQSSLPRAFERAA